MRSHIGQPFTSSEWVRLGRQRVLVGLPVASCLGACQKLAQLFFSFALLKIPNTHWCPSFNAPMSVLNRGSNTLNIDDKIHIHHNWDSMEIDDLH